jgi:3-oxoacyl-[acyl-carrier protein] reductase
MKLLQDKVVLITGASRGIGKAIAEECVNQGAIVAFTYFSSEEKALALEKELTANGGVAKGFKSDAGNFDAAQILVDSVVETFGTVDVLINNAGITRDTLLMRMTEQQWDDVINTNLKSAFNLTKAVQKPMLKARKGSIINMSSVVGVSGNAGQSNYAASKAGLIGLTKTVAKELGARGVTCNAIAPGFIETDMTSALDETQTSALLGQIPLGRLGSAADIAHAVAFLASPNASYITGTTLHVNGGMYM